MVDKHTRDVGPETIDAVAVSLHRIGQDIRMHEGSRVSGEATKAVGGWLRKTRDVP